MNLDNTKRIYGVPLLTMSVLALGLGLAACDPKPTEEQASRDTSRIIEQAPPSTTTAGTGIDRVKSADKDVVAKSAGAEDDVALNLKVQEALNANATLKQLPIIVQTDSGVVTLSGTADTPAKRSQAEQVAMNVNGVRAVENKLAVGAL